MVDREIMSIEDFAFRCLWMEHVRLRSYISEHEASKHFRQVLAQCKRGDSGLLTKGKRTAWTSMIECWYKQMLSEVR